MKKQDLLNTLPTNIIMKVMDDLLDYDETYIIYENSNYIVTPNIGVRFVLPHDYKFIGKVNSKDIYTDLERDEIRKLRDNYYKRLTEILIK